MNKVTDHLANERTFLAWIRTALGLIGLGFILARMGLFLIELSMNASKSEYAGKFGKINQPHHGLHAGHEFVITGIIFLIIGTAFGGVSVWFHARTQRAIDSGGFEPTRGPVLALTTVVVIGGLVVTGLVLWRVMGSILG